MLTPKREKFAHGVASGLNQSDAYRAAFNAGGMKPATINVKASQLMADGKVRERVNELRAPIAEKAQITLESHLADLKELRDMAVEARQMGAAISAEVARGKAAGVVVDRASLELTGKGGAPIAMAAITPDEYRRIALEVASKT